jgi:hypothetical protein
MVSSDWKLKTQGRRFRTLLLLPLLALAMLAQAHAPTRAFEPDAGHLVITNAALGKIKCDATGSACHGEGGDGKLEFTPNASKEIGQANKDTDAVYKQGFASYHFDDEALDAGSRRLLNLKTEIIRLLLQAKPDGKGARQKLGSALHTLQDFYSHSNWVDMGKSDIEPRLGKEIIPKPSILTAFCPNNDYTLEGAGKSQLTTGYFKFFTPGIPLPNLGCTFFAPFLGKCTHGFDHFGLVCRGIAKDSARSSFHEKAKQLAEKATIDYILQILSEFKGNPKAIKAFMGIGNTLAMVIDVTGSMENDIGAVKSQVASEVNRLVGTDEEPAQYTLLAYADPWMGQPFQTADPQEFIAQVNALTIEDGFTCPEPAFSALLKALRISDPGTKLFLFTDADASDGYVAPAVLSLLREKAIEISPILSGTCANERQHSRQQQTAMTPQALAQWGIDPAYQQLADASGGHLVLADLAQPQVFGNLLFSQWQNDIATILTRKGPLTPQTQTISFPVDSTISQLLITTQMDLPLDRDYYRFPGQAGEAVTITVHAPLGSLLDPYLNVYLPDGVTQLAANDNVSETVDAQIAYVLPEDGAYLVQVANSNGEITGSAQHTYTLSIEKQGALTPTLRQEIEPNESSSTAMSLAVGDVVVAHLRLPPAGTLIRPSGEPVRFSDADVAVTDLYNGQMLLIQSPAVGVWTMQLKSLVTPIESSEDAVPEEYAFHVKARTALDIYKAEFVEQKLYRHEGLFPISGQPLAGTVGTMLVTLFDAVQTAQFNLLTANGAIIRTVDALQDQPLTAADQLVGTLAIADEPFRLAVVGQTKTGQPFERLYGPLFQPQSVQLAFAEEPYQLLNQEQQAVALTVTNFGESADFTLAVTADPPMEVILPEDTLTLAHNMSSTVTLYVTPLFTPTHEATLALSARLVRRDTDQLSNTTQRVYPVFFPPPLILSPGELSFFVVAGGKQTAAQSLNIELLDDRVAWTLTTATPWLKIDQSSGVGSDFAAIAVDPTGLAIGEYTGAITVRTAGEAIDYPVFLRVQDPAAMSDNFLPLIRR